MGSCIGRCFLQRRFPSFRTHSSDSSYDNDFNFLVDDSESTNATKPKKRHNFMARILSKNNKSRSKTHKKKPVLELVEDLFHATPGSSYSRLSRSKPKKPPNLSSSNALNQVDIPLQCLDVRALLSKTVDPPRSSTPGSSLDLEWEHETLPVSLHDPSISSWAALPEENLGDLPRTSSSENTAKGNNDISDWSRVSSADSLEWDPGRSETPTGSVDTDTRQLLQEIEILTDQALRETGMQLADS